MSGFVYSLVVAIIGFILNIIIYKNVKSEGDVIMFCSLIIIASLIGLIVCIARRKKTQDQKIRNLQNDGIRISILSIVLTVIFLISDIINLNTVHWVPVHS